jgi:hypothetical protein
MEIIERLKEKFLELNKEKLSKYIYNLMIYPYLITKNIR